MHFAQHQGKRIGYYPIEEEIESFLTKVRRFRGQENLHYQYVIDKWLCIDKETQLAILKNGDYEDDYYKVIYKKYDIQIGQITLYGKIEHTGGYWHESPVCEECIESYTGNFNFKDKL